MDFLGSLCSLLVAHRYKLSPFVSQHPPRRYTPSVITCFIADLANISTFPINCTVLVKKVQKRSKRCFITYNYLCIILIKGLYL